MPLAEFVGRRIQEIRVARGLTQAQLAEASGMTADEVSRIERATREPRFDTLERLAAALEVHPADFLKGAAVPRRVAHDDAATELPSELRRGLAQASRALERAVTEYSRSKARQRGRR